jgi:hypothetical protein
MKPKTTVRSLSSEEMDVLLQSPAGAEEDTNMGNELYSLRSVLADLRSASTATAAHHHCHASIISSQHSISRNVWTFATATVLLIGIATPLAFHHHAASAPVTTAATHTLPTAVSDDVLFANVQSDISASVPSPMLPLTTVSTTTQSTSKGNAQ